MRSLNLFGPIATDVGVAKVIGQHEDDVREFQIRNLGAYSHVIRIQRLCRLHKGYHPKKPNKNNKQFSHIIFSIPQFR